MKRLLEEHRDPAPGSLADLVRSRPPFALNPFSKRFVHSKVLAQITRGRRRFTVKPVALAGSALLLAAGAAAAVGYVESERQAGLAVASVARSVREPAPSKRRAPGAEAPSLEAPSVAVAPTEAPAPPVANAAKASPSRAIVESRIRAPRHGEDPTQVSEALRALRKQGDPLRAQQLLDAYLKTNPRGVLTEDALALAIEAAATRKDPKTAEYARRYLSRYPNGRFRAVAERALQRSSR